MAESRNKCNEYEAKLAVSRHEICVECYCIRSFHKIMKDLTPMDGKRDWAEAVLDTAQGAIELGVSM